MKKNLILLVLCGLLILWGSSCKKNDDVAPTAPESPAPAPTSTFTVTPTSTPCPAGSFGEPVTVSELNIGINYSLASPFALATTAAVTALSAPFEGGETFRLAIYSDSAGLPYNRLAISTSSTAVAGWNTVAVGPVTLTAGTYFLAVCNTADPLNFQNYANNSSGSTYSCDCNLSNPWVPDTSWSTHHLVIRAHYPNCP